VRCAPPQNKPAPDERDRCLPYLVREWALLTDVRVVVALGAFAHAAVADLLAQGVRSDLTVSGLPWLLTSPKETTIFPALGRLAAPGGAVTQLAHAWIRFFPAAKQVQRNLEAAFEEVVVSRTVWRNAPPAVVYVARRPRVTGA
jgi:phospholipid N-methyltransferase